MNQKVCPVCNSRSVEDFLSRCGVPVHQHLLFRDIRSARGMNRGDLSLAVCRDCGFIHNRAFDAARLRYGEGYDNSQTHSPFFEGYLSGLVDYLVAERGIRNSRIVEVGCGKGWFLRKLVEFEGAGNTGFGFDPSYEGDGVSLDGRLRFERSFYDERQNEIRADVVICRHVIEHVPEPLELLGTVRRALIGSPDARVFFETPCVEWILKNRAVWDFFYEHCSYFSADSLRTAFELSGFRVDEIRRLFGGQYLWLEASVADEKPASRLSGGLIARLATRFAASERNLIDSIRAALIRQTRGGRKIAFWGAGAKGATLANLVDPERELIRCVVDLNPEKQGKFLPGTGHPIVSCRELPYWGIDVVILMNSNYIKETMSLLTEARIRVSLVDLMTWLAGGDSRIASPLPSVAEEEAEK